MRATNVVPQLPATAPGFVPTRLDADPDPLRVADLAARDCRDALACAVLGVLLAFALSLSTFAETLRAAASVPVVVALATLFCLCLAAPIPGSLVRRSGPAGGSVVGALYGLACAIIPAVAGWIAVVPLDPLEALLAHPVAALFAYLVAPALWAVFFGGLPAVLLGFAFAARARR